ncbi:MAG: Holliday junction resolvase RuvX [Acidimicrobiales bacterium]
MVGVARPRWPWPGARTWPGSTRRSTRPAARSRAGDRRPVVRSAPGTGGHGPAGTRRGHRPGRAVGLDLGSRRIGVAVSDSAGQLASPRTTLSRTNDVAADRRTLVSLVLEEGAGTVVVGLPLSLRGDRGTAAKAAEAEAAALAELLEPEGVEVELFDERLTTVSAHAALAETGKTSRQRRSVVDCTAATVLLQAWLDGRRQPRGDR